MSNTSDSKRELVKERFEVWWNDEGREFMKDDYTPIYSKALAWIAWSNGAYAALSSKLKLGDV